MARLLALAIVAALVIGGIYVLFGKERPYVLTRLTAARAIESTAQFQHKTKLSFEITQAESNVMGGACHNFEFSREKMPMLTKYLETGAMKFSAYGNQRAPYRDAREGSLDLSLGEGNFLVDHIDSCKTREGNKTTGAYELTVGKPVIEVNGIRKEGNRASVDFNRHFESFNEVFQALPRVQATKEMETVEEHLTAHEKSTAPFWTGSAELTQYDDGWRVVTVKLSTGRYSWKNWDYGPEWPDPDFNWTPSMKTRTTIKRSALSAELASDLQSVSWSPLKKISDD
jgi:hypothetical protein